MRKKLRSKMKTKVFCIGFHKTGTTSMAVALKQLGYKVTGPNGVNDPDIEKNVRSMAYNLVDEFDASKITLGQFCIRN